MVTSFYIGSPRANIFPLSDTYLCLSTGQPWGHQPCSVSATRLLYILFLFSAHSAPEMHPGWSKSVSWFVRGMDQVSSITFSSRKSSWYLTMCPHIDACLFFTKGIGWGVGVGWGLGLVWVWLIITGWIVSFFPCTLPQFCQSACTVL